MGGSARLKSHFVVPAAAVSSILALLALFNIIAGGHDRPAWCGVLIANVVLPAHFTWLLRGTTARTSEFLPFLLLASGAGSTFTAWEIFVEGAAGWPLLIPALAGSVALVIYVFWYSIFGRQPSEILAVGQKLPAFELATADGAIFRSADLVGSPAVLIFYRGNWCPFCMGQVREIAGHYDEFARQGVALVFISPQDAAKSRQLAARYDSPMRFLVDESNRLAKKFGIDLRYGVPIGLRRGYAADTLMPTVVALNASGTIVYSDQTDNYRMRPEPDIFASILRRAGTFYQ
jgi:peroxiredoxin